MKDWKTETIHVNHIFRSLNDYIWEEENHESRVREAHSTAKLDAYRHTYQQQNMPWKAHDIIWMWIIWVVNLTAWCGGQING